MLRKHPSVLQKAGLRDKPPTDFDRGREEGVEFKNICKVLSLYPPAPLYF